MEGATVNVGESAQSRGGLRKLATDNADAVFEDARHATGLGTRHRTWQYAFAGLAVATGAAAGVGGLADIAWLAGGAGVIASALAAFQSKSDLNSGSLSRFHFNRGAGLEDVGRRYRSLAEGPEEPTREDLNALSVEWKKLQSGTVESAEQQPPKPE
jgi:hypothetical protein